MAGQPHRIAHEQWVLDSVRYACAALESFHDQDQFRRIVATGDTEAIGRLIVGLATIAAHLVNPDELTAWMILAEIELANEQEEPSP